MPGFLLCVRCPNATFVAPGAADHMAGLYST
jgi:hypothetical protein